MYIGTIHFIIIAVVVVVCFLYPQFIVTQKVMGM